MMVVVGGSGDRQWLQCQWVVAREQMTTVGWWWLRVAIAESVLIGG